MANLTNINNKFLVTTGGNVLIGQTATVGSSILQITGNSTFAGNIIISGADTNTGYDRYLKLYGNSDPTTNPNRWAGLAVYNNGGNNVNELAFFTGSGDSARTEKLRISSTGNATFAGNVSNTSGQIVPNELSMGNNKKILFGNGDDLQIYHDGSNSYIQNLTGWLNIPLSQNGISIANADFSESIARFLVNGAVELYYDGAKKFETVSTGVDVFGTSGNTNVRVYDSSANSEVGLKLQGDAATWTLQNWGSGGDKLRILNNAGSSMQVWEDNGSVIFGATDINGSFGASNTVVAIKGSSSGGEGILQITGLGNSATDNVGKIDFHSQAEADPMCSIRSVRGSADDQGELQIWTNNGGAPTERMRIDSFGQTKFLNRVEIQAADTATNPSAGTNARLIIDNNSNTNGCFAVMDFRNYSTFITARIGAQFQDADDKNTDLYFMTRPNNGSLTERMRITSGGELFVGDTGTNYGYSAHHIAKSSSQGYALIVRNSNTSTQNNSVIQLNQAETTGTTQGYLLIGRQGDPNSGTNRIFIYSNGDIKNSNNVYGQISDERKKENIIDASPKLNDLMKVKVKNFNFKGDDLKQIGVVAQELEEIFPGMISESKDPDSEDETLYKSVKYSVFVPMLIKAIQELKAEIDELKK